jgi:subfamily B ATP-binding cassette protein MsbA
MAKKKEKNEKRYQSPGVGQEWFDREYTAGEVYGRLWGFARRSKRLIFLGAFLGMLTGGLWAPLFTTIQPMIQEMQKSVAPEAIEAPAVPGPATDADATASLNASTDAVPAVEAPAAETAPQKDSKLEGIRRVLGKIGIESEVSVLTVLAIIMVLAVVVKMTTQYFNHYYLVKAGMLVVMDVRNAMFEHLQQQSLTFHGRSDVGKLMSRATGDPETIRTLISQTMSDICRAPFEILVAVAFVCYHAVSNDMIELLLIAVFGYPACMLPVVWIGKQIRKWSKRLLEQGASIGSNFHENLTCIRIVKAYHTETTEIERYKEYNLRAYKMCMRGVRLSTLVGPLTETIAILLALSFVAFCFMKGHGLDAIVPLIPPFLIMYKPMKQLGRLQAALENGRAALQRIFSLLDVHEELPEKPDAKPLTTFQNEVTFKNVDFAYTPGGKQILKDANFTIKRGQMFAVVGSTGSGKTTLANLLARFYDATSGTIEIDGTDVRDYKIEDVRSIVGAVTQEAILFNTTIAENIAYGSPHATQEEIEAAAKLANAHAFIAAHPEGYQRIVGEKGFVLSGGERQRVAIARAILRNPPILILDEATSALDTVTEQQVQAAINNLMKNRTIFAIAHRLSTIKMADCILVLDQGEIVERGTHDELYAKGGVYRKLCDIQNSQE